MKTIRLASVVLAEAAADSPTTWVEVTREGDYKGYPGGGFRFTADTFGQIIRNFRSHPSFKLGPMGEGVADVIPWDFNHASEYPAVAGTLPTEGAPAQAWTQDLQLRMGSTGAELWAKVRWLEPARTYVKNGQYKWASVTVIFDARDPKTGASIGCLLTSIALTNTPFVEGMQPLVAASRSFEPPIVTKRVIKVNVQGVSPNSPMARALLKDLATRLSTPRGAPATGDEQPTAEEQVLAEATQRELRQKRDAKLPMQLNATLAHGRNPLEKAIATMCASVPGFQRLPWEEQVTQAKDALRLGVVRVNSEVAP